MAENTSNVTIWQEYEHGLAYQQSMGFTRHWPEYERFREGRQWPDPTPATRTLPRPVFNFIRQVIRSKKSNVLSQAVKMVFSPEELPEDEAERQAVLEGAQAFTDFSLATWEDLDQEGLNDAAMEDAAASGSGVFHYYWDASASGGISTKYIGRLRGDVIDPLNIFFGDPQQRDVQKQPWIIITGRRNTAELTAEAKALGGDPDSVQPDKNTSAEGYDSARSEMQGVDKTTWALKYFRQNGGVCWEKVTETAVIAPPRPLHPAFKMTLYPVEVFNWELRKKCIYGMGEVEGLIANQKLYNFVIAMLGLSVQQNAWPRIKARAGALQQNITNEPGEIITDYAANGDGVGYMNPPVFSQMPVELAGNILSVTKDITGVSDIITGETTNMAASAIISLQNQARMPIQNIQNRFYRSVRNIGRIWEQFFKACYSSPRPYVAADPATGKQAPRLFEGAQFAGIPFGLKVDVGPGTAYSESLVMATLDKLFAGHAITPAQYARYAPASLFPAGLRQELENADAGQGQQALQQQMQQGAGGPQTAGPQQPMASQAAGPAQGGGQQPGGGALAQQILQQLAQEHAAQQKLR